MQDANSRIAAWPATLVLLAFALNPFPNAVFARNEQAPPSAGALKKLSLDELMAVEVTSVSKRPEKLAQAASAIQVITQEDIRRSGATSLPEALRLASNLEVAQRDARQWAVSARGFNSNTSNKLLVLIDGRTVYTPLFAGVFWDAQDTLLEDVERIEVISGPGATLWGANAVNGVISVTTKGARHTQGPLLLGGGGDELRGFGGIRFGGSPAADLHYRVYAKYFDRDGTVLPSGTDSSDDWHVEQGGFRVDWDASVSNHLTVQGDIYDGRAAQAVNDDVTLSGGNLLGRWSRIFTESSDLQLQGYVDRTERRIPGSIAEDLNTYDLDFQHRFPVRARHDIVWGLGYRLIEDDVDNPPTLGFLPPRVSREWFNGFVQDEIALAQDRLQVTVGAKLEHNDYTGFEFQPSVRLAWTLNKQHTLWSAVSRAVRAPSRIDREFFVPSNPPFVSLAGSADFDSEILLAYELGYRGQPHERASLSLAAFYHDYDELRSVEQINPPAPSPGVIANGLEGKSYGAELTVDYRITDWWHLRAGLTELRVRIRPEPGSTDTTRGRNEARDPDRQFQLRASLDLPGRCELDATYRHVGRIVNQDVPAYGEIDLRFGWQPQPRLELALVGRNLLHDQHVEFGAAPTRREIERSVHGKISWGF